MNKIKLADWVQQFTKKQGADDCTVTVSRQRSTNVQYRDGRIDTLKESTSNSLYIEIYAKGKYSSHTTNDLTKPSLKKFIANAISMTKHLGEDPFKLLPDPKLYEGRTTKDLQLFDESISKMETTKRIDNAKKMFEHIRSKDDRIVSVSTNFSDSEYENIHLKSNGFQGIYRNTNFHAGAEVSLDDGTGKKPQNWRYYGTRHYKDLPDLNLIADEALQRTQDSVGQTKIKTITLPMILENHVTPRLLWGIFSALSGSNLQQKSSFLEGKKDHNIASDILSILDDPLVVRGMGSRYYDGDGIAAKPMPVLDKGVLKNYYIDVYYGRKLKMNPTTGRSSNLVFSLGDRSGLEIEQDMKKAILVTGFIGGNSNSTTGDFSLGITGWLIENGVRTKPINEMNISGNFGKLLNQLVELGNDPYHYSSWLTPTMVFDGITFAGL